MLLAQAHDPAGWGTITLAYANEMRTYSLSIPLRPDGQTVFAVVIVLGLPTKG